MYVKKNIREILLKGKCREKRERQEKQAKKERQNFIKRDKQKQKQGKKNRDIWEAEIWNTKKPQE